MKVKNIFFVIGIILVYITSGFGDIGSDKLLNEGVGVKCETAGGTYIGVENAVSVINYNPAAVYLIKNKNIEINYSDNGLSGINSISAGYGENNKVIGYGVSLMRKYIGGYEGYNEEMVGTGVVIDNSETGVSAGAGINIISRLYGGIGLKILNKSIAGYSGTGFGIDAGIYWAREERIKHSIVENLMYNIEGGIVVKNIMGPVIKLRDDSETEPMEIRIGIGYTFELLNLVVNRSGIRIMAEGIYREDVKDIIYVYGIELMIINNVSLLGGYGRDMYRAGISVNIKNFGFNYGYKHNSDMGATHNFGINIKIGNIKEAGKIKSQKPELTEEEKNKYNNYYYSGLDRYYKEVYKSAVELFKKALQIDPNSEQAKEWLEKAKLEDAKRNK